MYISKIMTDAPEDDRSLTENRVFGLLTELGINFERVDNDPVSTMDECRCISEVFGTEVVKTVVVCNRQCTKFYVVVMPSKKRFVTKQFSKVMGCSRSSFASAEDMQRVLKATYGSASPLSIVNDEDKIAEIVFDSLVTAREFISCNVGVNTTHIKIKVADMIEKYIPRTGHKAKIIEL